MQTKYLIQNNDDAIIPEETDEVFKGETRKGKFKEFSLSPLLLRMFNTVKVPHLYVICSISF